MTNSVLGATSVLCYAPHVAATCSSGVQSVSARARSQHAAPALQFGGKFEVRRSQRRVLRRRSSTGWGGSSAQVEPLDLTEENVEQVLLDARSELLQLFDVSVGITGVVQLVELDGPFVKIRLTGRFWHERSMVLARVANYLQKRIPEIVEVEIEDESQLDDSAANF